MRMATSGNEYKHKPLSSARCIRVIILKGTSRGLFKRSLPDQPLDIELEEVSLDSNPSYEALSYTWDGQSPDQPIRCHGRTLKITRNCEIALFRLRNSSKRRLWVDSICIDQTSASEKSVQVPLMGDIYGKSRKVLLWLGNATKASDLSFEYLKDVHRIILPYNLHIVHQSLAGTQPTFPWHVEQELEVRRLAFDEENKKMYGRSGTFDSMMLTEITTRSWFSRVWCLQELVLAQEAMLLCGDKEMTWGDFSFAMGSLSGVERKTTGLSTVPYFTLEMYHKLRSPIHQSLATSRWAPEKSLYQVLIRIRHLNSGDPRDKLYGLFGYLTRLGVQGLPHVDYNIEISQLYTDFTRFTILHDRSLKILTDLDGMENSYEIPSWTLDWSRDHKTSRINWNESAKLAASKDSAVLYNFESHNELHVRGAIVGRIKKKASSGRAPGLGTEETIETIVARIRSWQTSVSLAYEAKVYAVTEHRLNTLLRTLLRSIVFEEQLNAFPTWINILTAHQQRGPRGVSYVTHIDEAVQWALERPSIWALYFSGDLDPVTTVNTLEWRVMIALADPRPPGLQALHMKIVNHTTGMAVFLSEDGYLGIASDASRVGDEIALISGLELPMVVRRSDDGSFRFIAPAYVHGIMSGERWPEDCNLSTLVFK